MKAITKFQAEDGREFTSADKCEAYEKILVLVKQELDKLDKRPNSCDYSNGAGYIQHDYKLFITVVAEIKRLARKYLSSDSLRTMYESGVSSFSNAAHRFMCTDNDGREWGQPYYANHQNEAEQKRLN